ncbi:hypothetical protein SPURM210S_00620 [Streptomyces purpurascens]
MYSSAGERIRSRISRTAAAAAATDSETLACANTSVFPPVRFSPSDPDSSQAISRNGPAGPPRTPSVRFPLTAQPPIVCP